MAESWLSGLGAGLSQFGLDATDLIQRRRAQAQSQAQFEATQKFQKDNLDEATRHNQAMEALGIASQRAEAENAARLRTRQEIQDFQTAAAGGGVNYLDPQRAYQASKQLPTENLPGNRGNMASPGIDVGQVNTAMNSLNAASMKNWQSQIDPTAQRLAQGNVATGMIPGSEAIGGAILENRTFNPYAQYGANIRASGNEADREGLDYRSARDDIEAAGKNAYESVRNMATEIEKIRDTQQVEARANAAREAARRATATSWNRQLAQRYPQKAHLYTIEMLLGLPQGAPAASVPTQTSAGGNPFLGTTPPPQPQPQQQGVPSPRPPVTPPGRNPFIP